MSGVRRVKGDKFGAITLVEYVKAERKWIGKCDCGNESLYFISNLTRGNTTKCVACANISRSIAHTVHGKSPKGGVVTCREYTIWQAMKRRCLNENDPHYKYYGGRGITVCDRWLHSFENFYADMGKRTTEAHQIDRTDNDGNYEPSNCRWVTRLEQANNKSDNVRLTIDGITKDIRLWAEKSPVHLATIKKRIKAGLTPKQAVFGKPISGNPLSTRIQT